MHIVLSSGIFISLPPSLPPPLSSLSVSHTRHTHTYIQSLFTHRRQATPEERTRLFPLALILFTHTHTHTHRGAYGEDEAKGQQRLAPPSDVEPADTL